MVKEAQAGQADMEQDGDAQAGEDEFLTEEDVVAEYEVRYATVRVDWVRPIPVKRTSMGVPCLSYPRVCIPRGMTPRVMT